MRKAGLVPEEPWKITTNRYVAYIDIMGFKDMVLRTDHADIYKNMLKIDKQIRKMANVSWDGETSKLIKTTNYSDSIIIYSKDNSSESLHSFICTVAAATNDLLVEGFPHKGAVAFGMMTFDTSNSIFFGQPLIDAFLLQEELEFYGIIAHGTIEKEIKKHMKDNANLFIEDYRCNLKKGNSLHLTIYPMNLIGKSKKASDKLFESCQKMRFKTSGHLRKYIDNTESYIKCMKTKVEDRWRDGWK